MATNDKKILDSLDALADEKNFNIDIVETHGELAFRFTIDNKKTYIASTFREVVEKYLQLN